MRTVAEIDVEIKKVAKKLQRLRKRYDTAHKNYMDDARVRKLLRESGEDVPEASQTFHDQMEEAGTRYMDGAAKNRKLVAEMDEAVAAEREALVEEHLSPGTRSAVLAEGIL